MKMTGIEGLLHAQFEPMSLEYFGILLFGGVYVELSAFAVVDDADRVVAFKLLDATFPSEVLIRSLSSLRYEDSPDGAYYADHDDYAGYDDYADRYVNDGVAQEHGGSDGMNGGDEHGGSDGMNGGDEYGGSDGMNAGGEYGGSISMNAGDEHIGDEHNGDEHNGDEHTNAWGNSESIGMRAVLFSNHPTGSMSPTADDLRIMELVSAAELYIVYEDECMAAEINA